MVFSKNEGVVHQFMPNPPGHHFFAVLLNRARRNDILQRTLQAKVSVRTLPSMTELGINDYDIGGWYGLFGPLGMSTETTQRIGAAAARALQNPELRQRWIDQGYVIWPGSAADLNERLRREHALWAEVTRGMQFD